MVQQKNSQEIEDKRLARWQNRLLPFMIGVIIAVGIFFFVASLYQLQFLHKEVRHKTFDLAPLFQEYEQSLAQQNQKPDFNYLEWKVRALLEQNVVERRYHQVNSAMLARVWTRYLGFLTGMILALVGATFILGKLREPLTKIKTEGKGFGATLETTSPGIVLAFLGTLLMAITIIVPFDIETRDKAVYTPRVSVSSKISKPLQWPGDSLLNNQQQENELFDFNE